MTLDEFFRQFGSVLQGGVSVVGLGLVVLAGIVASAVCPCTLPVGLTMASASAAAETEVRRGGMKIALAFFVGIVVNLTVLGALTGRLGALATQSFGKYWALGMAVVSFGAAALAFLGLRLGIAQLARLRRTGASGAFGYGFLFSLGTSVAPLLLLLTVTAARGNPLEGLVLAFAFGLGRGLPFLVAGVMGSAITGFTKLGNMRRTIQVISGTALLFVGFYYVNTYMALR